MYVCVYIYIYVIHLSLSLYVYIYIYVYVCMYVYVYMCVYIYIYIFHLGPEASEVSPPPIAQAQGIQRYSWTPRCRKRRVPAGQVLPPVIKVSCLLLSYFVLSLSFSLVVYFVIFLTASHQGLPSNIRQNRDAELRDIFLFFSTYIL